MEQQSNKKTIGKFLNHALRQFGILVFYFFSLLTITGFSAAFGIGVLIGLDSPDSSIIGAVGMALFGAVFLMFFGVFLLVISASMFTILLPVVSRFSLVFFGPVLWFVILVSVAQSWYATKWASLDVSWIGIAFLSVFVLVPTHVLTLSFAAWYSNREPKWAKKIR